MDSPFEPRLPSGREKRIGVSLNSVASHQFENPTPLARVPKNAGSLNERPRYTKHCNSGPETGIARCRLCSACSHSPLALVCTV